MCDVAEAIADDELDEEADALREPVDFQAGGARGDARQRQLEAVRAARRRSPEGSGGSHGHAPLCAPTRAASSCCTLPPRLPAPACPPFNRCWTSLGCSARATAPSSAAAAGWVRCAARASVLLAREWLCGWLV